MSTLFSYLASTADVEDRASYEACGTLGPAARGLTAWSAALVCSNLNSASQDHEGLAQWHAVGLARAGTHFYIYSSTFDPATASSPPRLSSQPGCVNAAHILHLLRTKKNTPYPPIKGGYDQPVKGRGLTVAKIWITGSGSTALECIPESTLFLYHVASGDAGTSPDGAITSNNAGYTWVQAVW